MYLILGYSIAIRETNPFYMCQKAVSGCLYIWKNNYGAIKTTLSNKHGHIENAYVIWNSLTKQKSYISRRYDVGFDLILCFE